MKHAASTIVLLLAPVLLALTGAWPVVAQDAAAADPTSETAEETVEEAPPPISLADIPAERAAFEKKSRDIRNRLEDSQSLDSIREEIDPLKEELAPILEKIQLATAGESGIGQLMDLDSEAIRHANLLEEATAHLDSATRKFEEDLTELDSLTQRWVALQHEATERHAPDTLIEQTTGTLAELEELTGAVEERRNDILTVLAEATELSSQVADYRAQAAAQRREMMVQSVTSEGEPIWSLHWERQGGGLYRHFVLRLKNDAGHLASYSRDNADQLALIFFGSLAVVLVLRWRLKAPAQRRAAEEPAAARALEVIDPAWPMALILTLAVTAWLAPTPAPRIFYRLLLLLMALPAAALTLRMVGSSLRASVLALVAALVFFPLQSYLELSPLLDRIVLLAQCLAVGAALTLDLRRGRWATALSGRWQKIGPWIIRISILLLGVSSLAAIFGLIGPAREIRTGVIGSLGFAIIHRAIFLALDSIVVIWLGTRSAESLRVVRNDPERTHRFLRKALGILATGSWLASSLFAFDLSESASETARRFLGLGVTVRDVQITIGEVLAFVLIVSASFLLARIITLLLDEEFLPRLPLQRGIPYAISTLARYVILLSGFALALVAAGLDLSKATFLAGAFGIGIGFGLQNVVNNFVSGLILLFERPVQVGDAIEVGTLLGEVTDIGIRASTVRTFQGAEVIVPNGNLISKEVVNWTLSNRRRRVEILIGVAYGTDPEQVIEILLGVAKAHPDVQEDPAPSVVFTGFGDSSLDFQLKCWVERFELAVEVASELRVAVNRALADAGIEIPFPQRDINVHTVGEGSPLSLAQSPSEPPQDSEPGS
ncbi:MAG: mechanosensitive ion channel [Nitrospirae bacterium]|nr:mechanosensitive ion channel [Nitrospirota bacterium]